MRSSFGGLALRAESALLNYLYDREGRVVRDYSATYLPWTRTRPALTLISLHRHAPALHAWRTFDASGNRVFEACEGSLGDGPVAIRVDYADPAGMSAAAKVLESRAYRACFEGCRKAREHISTRGKSPSKRADKHPRQSVRARHASAGMTRPRGY